MLPDYTATEARHFAFLKKRMNEIQHPGTHHPCLKACPNISFIAHVLHGIQTSLIEAVLFEGTAHFPKVQTALCRHWENENLSPDGMVIWMLFSCNLKSYETIHYTHGCRSQKKTFVKFCVSSHAVQSIWRKVITCSGVRMCTRKQPW